MRITDAAALSTARTACPSMFMADDPPLVSCNSQRNERPSFQARSTAVSGASDSEATAIPSTSPASMPASASAAITASRMKVCVDCSGRGRRT
jgi:hypothetical protein